MGRTTCARADGCHGASFYLVLAAVARCSPEYRFFEKAMGLPEGARLFVNVAYGQRTIVPSYDSDDRVGTALKNNAYEVLLAPQGHGKSLFDLLAQIFPAKSFSAQLFPHMRTVIASSVPADRNCPPCAKRGPPLSAFSTIVRYRKQTAMSAVQNHPWGKTRTGEWVEAGQNFGAASDMTIAGYHRRMT